MIRRYPGVISTRVGYSGGDVPNATYRNHGSHAEAIEILFDPARIGYRDLLEFFFQIHDPTTRNRQGNDIGPSYRSAIFYLTTSRSASPRTRSPTWKPRACGPARSSPRWSRPAISGKPSRSIRTISSAIPMATPAISRARTGNFPSARKCGAPDRRFHSCPPSASARRADGARVALSVHDRRRSGFMACGMTSVPDWIWSGARIGNAFRHATAW